MFITNNMDARETNIVKAVVLAVLTMIPMIIIQMDIRNQEIAQVREQCIDCTVDYNPFSMLFAIPSIAIFLITLWYLEKKRIKTWRSY